MWKQISECRLCGSSEIEDVFSLGMQVVKDFLDSPNMGTKKGPLDMVLCRKCGLLQLKHTFSKEYLYTHYWYRSSTSPTMVKELNDIVHNAKKHVQLNSGDIVIDIGSNDGTLLRQYNYDKLLKVGFEPSNLWKFGVSPETIIINDYFNAKAFTREFPGKKAKIITSIAMFYDLDDPNSFTEDVRTIMDPQGVWIVQMNYLGLMLRNLGYDNICHEHVGYYSLTTMLHLLERHDLQVFDLELNNVNGGSFRLYIKHILDNTKEINSKKIEEVKRIEGKMHLSEPFAYFEFDRNIQRQREDMRQLLSETKQKNKKIFIYGASTRGLVILEYCGIDDKITPFATDKNSDKWGKYLSGTGIRIIPLEEYRRLKPDFLLVLPYQYANEIAYQESAFMDGGGQLIIPLPVPKILDKEYFYSIKENNNEFLGGYDKL